MGINTTITCDGCEAVIPAASGYLSIMSNGIGHYKGEVPGTLIFCNQDCISEYKPVGA
jgi:hypothetical protein